MKTITFLNATSKVQPHESIELVPVDGTISYIRDRVLSLDRVNVPGDVWIQYVENPQINLEDKEVPPDGATLLLSRPGGPPEEGWIMLYVSRPKEHKDLPLREVKLNFIRVWIPNTVSAATLFQRLKERYHYPSAEYELHCQSLGEIKCDDRSLLDYGIDGATTVTLTLTWLSIPTSDKVTPLYDARQMLEENVDRDRRPGARRGTAPGFDDVFEKGNLSCSPHIGSHLRLDMDGYTMTLESKGRRSNDPFPWERGHFVAFADGGTNTIENFFPLSVQANLIDALDGGRLHTPPGEALTKTVRYGRRSQSPLPTPAHNDGPPPATPPTPQSLLDKLSRCQLSRGNRHEAFHLALEEVRSSGVIYTSASVNALVDALHSAMGKCMSGSRRAVGKVAIKDIVCSQI